MLLNFCYDTLHSFSILVKSNLFQNEMFSFLSFFILLFFFYYFYSFFYSFFLILFSFSFFNSSVLCSILDTKFSTSYSTSYNLFHYCSGVYTAIWIGFNIIRYAINSKLIQSPTSSVFNLTLLKNFSPQIIYSYAYSIFRAMNPTYWNFSLKNK